MDQNAFTQFRRTQIAEMRPYIPGEEMTVRVPTPVEGAARLVPISISAPDREAGSPKPGDMIARNPANHDDQWLVSADYFAANFEPMTESLGEKLHEEAARASGATAGINFFDRLKNERRELDERLSTLNHYLANNPGAPNPSQRPKLEAQAKVMSEYLAILDERISDVMISQRSENIDGE